MATETQESVKKDLYKPTAEQLVIAGLVLNGDFFNKIHEIITNPQMFHDIYYQEIYATMELLAAKNEPIDYITITSNSSIDSARLSKIVTNLPVPDEVSFSTEYLQGKNLETYAKIVAQAFIRRELYAKVHRGEDIDSVLETISQLEKQGLDKFFNPLEFALQVMGALKATDNGLPYPFKSIQKATNGIHKGQIVIVAARPSTGKSTILENIATSLGQAGKKVLFATAEMSAEMIGLRTLSRLVRKNLFYDRDKLTPQETEHLEEEAHKLSALNVFIHEFTSVAQLEQVIKEKGRDFDLVIVDYLQLLEPKLKARSPYERVTAVANELTQIAKKYHLPFIVAAQYNRMAEKQQPSMADLKESGQIEQNADVIISLWSKDEDKIDQERQKVRYDILKNRNGFTLGNFKEIPDYFLWFDKKYFEFTDPDIIHPDQPALPYKDEILEPTQLEVTNDDAKPW